MTVKSQDDLGKKGRDVEVLLSTIEELERTKKQLEIAKTALILLLQGEKTIKHKDGAEELIETYALAKIKELEK